MGETLASQPLRQQFAGRWQIPLLLLSGTMLVLGVWRLRPVPKPPTFEELYGHAAALHEAALYPEASSYLETLLADPARTPPEQGRLHRLMAEVIFGHESGNALHGATNVTRIIEHSDKAAAAGVPHDVRMHRIRATAWEWLQRPADAVVDYTAAINLGVERPWELRKRILEIQKTTGTAAPDQLHAAYDTFLSAEDVTDELRYWAAEQKVELCEQEEKREDAERFLAAHAAQFQDPMWRKAYDYLQALVWFHMGRVEDADRLLRTLRDEVPPGHSLYGRSGWLLGRILQAEEAPEIALSFFEEVVTNTTPGPYRTASILGRAEALALLNRYAESVQGYNEAIRLTTENPYGAVIDLRVVRESTLALHQSLLAQKRLKEALGYLQIAGRLVPPADNAAQAMQSERVADLSLAIGRELLQEAEQSGAALPPELEEARRYLTEAGEEYVRLSRFTTLSDAAYDAAIWHAVEAFDLAGQRERTLQVLEMFLAASASSTRAPTALLRMGQTLQAMGEYEKAIARYQQALLDFPRTPSAIACLVPLADCFLATGRREAAEEILLRILIRRPDDPLSLITPAAVEYRESLFRLGELYMRTEEFEKAIARYEEAVERYKDDPRHDRATYLLADAYRRSAARIRLDLQEPRSIPFRDDLEGKYRTRMNRARELYGRVIAQYQARTPGSLSELDRLQAKLSHFYRADVVYDLSRVSGSLDLRPLAESIELYERAAWLYQSDPMAMTAYVQMINCQLRMGEVAKARMTLQRARWTLRSIADEQFRRHAPAEDRAFWENYLTWLERTPTFAAAPPVSG